MSININGKLRIKGATTGGSGGGTPNYTFKTTAVGGANFAYIETSTGYIKFNATVYNLTETGGEIFYTLDDPNGEYTLVSCDEFGAPSGDIIALVLENNQLISFNSTGLTSLVYLFLSDNQLTSFNGTGLTSLTSLRLNNNQLTSFNGTGLTSLIELELNNNQITSFDGTGLSILTQLLLDGNQLTSFDASPFTNLNGLVLRNNLLDSSDNNSILAQLDANGVENGYFASSGGRTSSSDTAYNNLIGKGWSIDIDPPVTFITSKSVGEFVEIQANSTTGYWKYKHDGNWNGPFTSGVQAEVFNSNGEFTIAPCLNNGVISGSLDELYLGNNQITSFNGTGLSLTTSLQLEGNQLTSFNGLGMNISDLGLGYNGLTSLSGFIFPSALTSLNLDGNSITSYDFTTLPNLTNLLLENNGLTSLSGFTFPSGLIYLSLVGNQLTSYDFTTLPNLTGLNLRDNQLTSLSGFTLPTTLTFIEIGGSSITSYDFTTLPNLTNLGLGNMGLTSLSGFTLPSNLTGLFLGGNQLTSFDASLFTSLFNLQLEFNPLDSSDNNSILAQLDDNGVENGYFVSSGDRTSASDTDYNNLIGKGWTIDVNITPA